MRKITCFIIAICAVTLFSCAGSEEKLAQMKKYRQVMIVEVSANKIIGWVDEKKKDENDSLAQAKLLGKLMNSKKVEEGAESAEKALYDTPYDIIDEAGNMVEKALIDSGAFKVLPFSSADKNKIAWSTSKLAKAADSRVRPKDYQLFDISKKNVVTTCEALGLDAVIVVSVEYEKEMHNGVGHNGSMKCVSHVRMSVIDNTGKTVWTEYASASSDKQFPVVMEVVDKKKFNTGLVTATANASKTLFNDFSKKLESK
ncbi:MAG TPA: hypothetical protein PKK43_07390 [Spirochaetota bacterium]|nr:hypothetical protein [Spirochaetota bacterium]